MSLKINNKNLLRVYRNQNCVTFNIHNSVVSSESGRLFFLPYIQFYNQNSNYFSGLRIYFQNNFLCQNVYYENCFWFSRIYLACFSIFETAFFYIRDSLKMDKVNVSWVNFLSWYTTYIDSENSTNPKQVLSIRVIF